MNTDVKGKKWALITGGSRGIGRSLAHYFVEQGFSLILIACNDDGLIKTKVEIESQYPLSQVDIYNVDFNLSEEMEMVIPIILNRYENIDVLVNSAGVLIAGNISMSFTDLSRLINVNLLSTMMVCNFVATKMKQQGFGEIYNIGSTAGLVPVSKIAAYSATKSAIISYSQSLYDELLPFNITVCCLCPSVVNTDMTNDGRISNELKIEPEDLNKAMQFIRTLSSGAAMSMLSIRCRAIDLE
ncbi:SDR family NAD(P)-dependent oxidoreductase [Photobacterium angustum]|uniref:Short-chain dehydrogenase n=1 Tax=Photobacterium angustum TaxID=661 RepID=A0A2S7VL64_PHOAN|nr:SDR family NAD(P)-dependent oxidoreductase [Photobacterium angustum]PQJ62877.1 short-chain dehydrogenase [Photobacterium angustum]